MLTPSFLTKRAVLRLHDRQIEKFGGTLGVREGLLESALAQAEATFSGELLHPTIYAQAAAYLYHISRNHPFVDGNKRTAFAAMEAFLQLNGCNLKLSNEEVYELVLKVAQGQLGKEELIACLEQVVIQVE